MATILQLLIVVSTPPLLTCAPSAMKSSSAPKYEFSKGRARYRDAKKKCDGKLAMPRTQEEVEAFVDLLTEHRQELKSCTTQGDYPGCRVWIGLDDIVEEAKRDPEKFKWNDGSFFKSSSEILDWYLGEPTNGVLNNEDCVEGILERKGFQWRLGNPKLNDEWCGERLNYVCEPEPPPSTYPPRTTEESDHNTTVIIVVVAAVVAFLVVGGMIFYKRSRDKEKQRREAEAASLAERMSVAHTSTSSRRFGSSRISLGSSGTYKGSSRTSRGSARRTSMLSSGRQSLHSSRGSFNRKSSTSIGSRGRTSLHSTSTI